MGERVRFVLQQEHGWQTMTELCEIYYITRETGDWWLRRYQRSAKNVWRPEDSR